MASRQIHLVRHGEVFNPDRILYGRLPEFGLSDRGHEMAALAAADLAARGRTIERIIASPLQRTRESAAPVSQVLNLPVDIDERLIEPTNVFEGKRLRGEDGALRQASNWRYLVNPFRPSWGEPYRRIASRMRESMLEAITNGSTTDEAGDIVMVSHQLPIWMVHRDVMRKPFIHDPRARRCALSSITTLELVDPLRPEKGFVEVGYTNPAEPLNVKSLDVGAV